MRKTFPLTAPNKQPARVLDAVKHDIRRYMKRERNRSLPADANVWLFDCQVGADAASARVVRVSELIAAVDAVATSGATTVYVEVLARAGQRTPRPAGAPLRAADEADAEPGED